MTASLSISLMRLNFLWSSSSPTRLSSRPSLKGLGVREGTPLVLLSSLLELSPDFPPSSSSSSSLDSLEDGCGSFFPTDFRWTIAFPPPAPRPFLAMLEVVFLEPEAPDLLSTVHCMDTIYMVNMVHRCYTENVYTLNMIHT